MQKIQTYANAKDTWRVGEIVEGADAYIFANAAKARGGVNIFIARDDARAASFKAAVEFFAPDIEILDFPAWDCLPYDRVSPSRLLASRRARTLYILAAGNANKIRNNRQARIIITTIAAIGQYVPSKEIMRGAGLGLQVGRQVEREKLHRYFLLNGYSRTAQVMEAGDYAVRGSIIDVFAAGFDSPVRLDFFGDELESMRFFDVESQRTNEKVNDLVLAPVSEVFLGEQNIKHFRSQFIAEFGGGQGDDPIYSAVSEAIRINGIEHFLPLFYPELASIFDYLDASALWSFDAQFEQAWNERGKMIIDYYNARKNNQDSGGIKVLPPERLYLSDDMFFQYLQKIDARKHSPFTEAGEKVMNMASFYGRGFSKERQAEGVNVFEQASKYIKSLAKSGKKVLLSAWSAGASERMGRVFADHDLIIGEIDNADGLNNMRAGEIKRVVLPLERGFGFEDMQIISEQDILGDRLVRRGRVKRAKNFIAEISSLNVGDLVIHIDHGLGRYQGLETLQISDQPHDCLKLEYRGGARLYLPVENIELLSRYGSGDENVVLDRLGGTAWQSRKARAREKLKQMAEELINIAAARALKTCDEINVSDGEFGEFCARFPYVETEDQLRAIDDVINDLSSGKPMDRLICGDVGFGKTEIALRAAYLVAMSGRQVAVITPTTILCRQHFASFSARFRGLPLKTRQLSRLITPANAKQTREELKNGQCDIVIGTHALLAKNVEFSNLGLVIIDEEQRFGVGHKERLKALKANVHVLTLSATPIPRTLQMALSGIRDLSLIATPPVDRLAVRTFITPWDEVILREALLREKYRGGQSFFVVPRIADLRFCEAFLSNHVPEVSYVMAHGQMKPKDLEDVMEAFYEQKYDVLLSTSIIESGLDIPSANSMIIYRADKFGLAQLYQMRGRVGRSKVRAFAYLTTPEQNIMTKGANERLKILQSLDTLGAGFSLASHDLDMRGGGNPLGEEQSGHIKDLGVELYQHMLEEAVASLRDDIASKNRSWSPNVNIGVPVLIPDTYVEDLNVRMSLYRRLSELENDEQADGFAAELIDRFGPTPPEIDFLLDMMTIKRLAKNAAIAKIDAGPKGVVFVFRKQNIKNIDKLLDIINQNNNWRLRPDHSLLVKARLDSAEDKIKMVKRTLLLLV